MKIFIVVAVVILMIIGLALPNPPYEGNYEDDYNFD
jgi:hypothetical protein